MGPVGPRTVFAITTAGDRIRESGWKAEIVPDCWLLSCIYFSGFYKIYGLTNERIIEKFKRLLLLFE